MPYDYAHGWCETNITPWPKVFLIDPGVSVFEVYHTRRSDYAQYRGRVVPRSSPEYVVEVVNDPKEFTLFALKHSSLEWRMQPVTTAP